MVSPNLSASAPLEDYEDESPSSREDAMDLGSPGGDEMGTSEPQPLTV